MIKIIQKLKKLKNEIIFYNKLKSNTVKYNQK